MNQGGQIKTDYRSRMTEEVKKIFKANVCIEHLLLSPGEEEDKVVSCPDFIPTGRVF